jgi:hypothetical protein
VVENSLAEIGGMTMAEYIEREAAFNAVLKLVPKVDDDGYCWVIRGDAAKAVDSVPAADVRPVVLCRDCKHRGNTPDCPFCWLADKKMGDEHFCSFGEKREES